MVFGRIRGGMRAFWDGVRLRVCLFPLPLWVFEVGLLFLRESAFSMPAGMTGPGIALNGSLSSSRGFMFMLGCSKGFEDSEGSARRTIA